MPARYENWSPDEYHSDTEHASHSQMEDFWEDPALYHGRHVSRTIERKETAVLKFGTLTHVSILRPNFTDGIVEIPERVLSASGARAGKAWQQFKEDHADKELLKPEEFQKIKAMRESILACPSARRLLEAKGPFEQAYTWTDTDTGIPCRALVDKICEKLGILADLKTARSAHPRAFAAAAYKEGYHRQASHYASGYAALTGEVPGFVFIAVEKTPPYRVETITLDPDFMVLGDESNAAILEGMQRCRLADQWHSDTWGQIVTVPPPAYAKYDHEWAFDRDE